MQKDMVNYWGKILNHVFHKSCNSNPEKYSTNTMTVMNRSVHSSSLRFSFSSLLCYLHSSMINSLQVRGTGKVRLWGDQSNYWGQAEVLVVSIQITEVPMPSEVNDRVLLSCPPHQLSGWLFDVLSYLYNSSFLPQFTSSLTCNNRPWTWQDRATSLLVVP